MEVTLSNAGRARPAASESVASAKGLANVGRLAAWVGIIVLALYMTVGEGSGWYGVYSVDLRIFTLVSLAAVFSAWALVAWRSPAWRPASVMWPAILAVLVAFGVASATSWRPRLSVEYASYAVLLAGLYLMLLRLLASDFFRPRLYGFAAVLTAGICAWYLWTVVGIWSRWWALVGRFAIPPLRPSLDGLSWGSPNTVAIMVILLLPPAIAWFGFGSRRRVVGLAALTGLVLLTVFLTGSRGAWLGLGGGLLVTATVWLAMPGHIRALRTAVDRLPLLRGPTAILFLLAAGGAAVAAPLIALRAGAGGQDLRAGLVGTALDMFSSDPLTGSGPGTWVVRRIAFTPAGGTDYYIPHAHNVYAQTLAEFGLVGLLAGAVVVLWLLALIWDGVRDADAIRRRFAWASLFSASYFGLHQLVDVYVGSPCVLFALALSVGYLDVTNRRSVVRFGGGSLRGLVPRARFGRLVGSAALALGIVAAAGFLGWSELQALPADRAIGDANAGDWAAAFGEARAAVAGDPDMPAYSFILGLAALHVNDAQAAAEAFARSAAADDFPLAWLDLAAARVQLGDGTAARDALTQALRLGQGQPSVAFGAGVLYLQIGDEPAAVDAFGAAIAASPTLATDAWFTTGPGAPLRTPALHAALARWNADAWDFALFAGDVDEARRRIATLEAPAARERAMLILSAWDGDAGARAQVDAASKAQPMDLTLVGWSARLARRAGDDAAVRRYRDWADIVLPGGGDFALDLRSTPGASVAPGYGGIDPNVYGVYTYHRPMPADLLAPTLLHLSLR